MDRNDFPIVPTELTTLSLSARRAWIEMENIEKRDRADYVALRKESVDRNSLCGPGARQLQNVALRKESVDRNYNAPHIIDAVCVALRKESVDRNV